MRDKKATSSQIRNMWKKNLWVLWILVPWLIAHLPKLQIKEKIIGVDPNQVHGNNEHVTKPKLFKVVKAITKSRSLEPNKVVVEFYVKFSHVLKEWYCKMIKEFIGNRKLSKGFNKCFITLIPIASDKKQHSN